MATQQTAYKMKVALKYFKPTKYRHVVVDPNLTFEQLHEIIQVLFGMYDYHLWDFSKGQELEIRVPDEFTEEYAMRNLNAKKTKLKKIFGEEGYKNLTYRYDYGDNREFDVALLKEVETDKPHPVLVKSVGGNLIEDCGGIPTLAELVEIYQKKDKKEAEEYGYEDRDEFVEVMEKVVNDIDVEEMNKGFERF